MNNMCRPRLYFLAVVALFLLSCSSTKYVSMKPELDTAFQWLTYDEIVGLMGREPDSVLNQENGYRSLIFNAVSEDEYFKSTFGADRRLKGGSKMYIKLLMNEDSVCYSVESNIVRRIDSFDKEKTGKTITSIIENILYMFTNPQDRYRPIQQRY